MELSSGVGPTGLGIGWAGHGASPVACGRRGVPRLGVPDRADDRGHGLLELVAVRRDDPGVRCDPERRDLTRGVQVIAPAQRLEDRRGRRALGVEAAFLGAAPGSLGHRRVQVDLEVGVGQHDRADVATGHHDPATGGEVALALQQRRPHLRDRGDGGDGRIDRRRAHIGRVIDPVHQHAGQTPVRVARELDFVHQPDEALGIVHRDAAGLGQPRDGAVQEAGIAEAVADLPGSRRPDAALARRAGPVEGHDQASHGSQDTGHSPADRARTASSAATSSSGG